MTALADHHRADEGRRTGRSVDNDAADEIHYAITGHDAATPDPVGGWDIDEKQPKNREDQQGGEFHPLDIGADEQRRHAN